MSAPLLKKIATFSVALSSLTFANALRAAPIVPSSYNVTAVGVPVNDVVYNSVSHEYIASVPSTAGVGLGNTLTRIGTDGTILGSTYVGSEPGILTLSADGSTGYVGMLGSSSVIQFNGLTSEPGQAFNLPPMWMGPTRARDLAVMPGDNSTVAVAVRNTCCSPAGENVSIYKNGQLVTAMNSSTSSFIEFGADPSTIYAYDADSSGFTLQTLKLDASGLHMVSAQAGLMYGYNENFQYQNGLIYSARGVVVNPVLGTQLGILPAGDGFTVDANQGLSFGIYAGQLTLGDLRTYVPLATYDLSRSVPTNYVGQAPELVAGDQGSLALNINHQLYILTAVPESTTGTMMIMGLGLLAFFMRKRSDTLARNALK